jgi:hypothetical protein
MDDLDNLVEENKKKHTGRKILLLILLLLGIFFAYKVLAPTSSAFALGNIPKVVYTKTQNISGCGAAPNSKIKIILNGNNPIFVDVDERGCMTYSAELNEGINKIDFYDLNSAKSDPVSVQIEYVIKPPSLEITQPLQNSEIKVATGKKDQEIIIKGKTDIGADIFVNGDKVVVNDDGSFETKIQLSLGEDKIKVLADNGDKTTEQEVTVKLVEETKTNNNSSSPNNTNGNPSSSSTNNGSNNNQPPTDQNQPEPQPLVTYPSKVIISYILYNDDALKAGTAEYIELKNTGDVNKDITGWTVSDGDGNSFSFPSYVLTPGSTVRVTTNSGRFLFNSTKPVWDRVGEAGYLKDASGKLVDAYSY